MTHMLRQCQDALNVVMVNTTLPANIGAAARAMHTMGLKRLSVVAPKHPIDADSQAFAAGGRTILDRAILSPDLPAAISKAQLVLATSSRSRHLPRPMLTPLQAADVIAHFIQQNADQSAPTEVAILFGREDRGLTNAELASADYHIQIPANPNYPVLNVAAAIQVIASFFYARWQQLDDSQDSAAASAVSTIDPVTATSPAMLWHGMRQHWDEPPITHDQRDQLGAQLLSLFTQVGLADPKTPRSLPNRLGRLSARLQLDQKEYQLLMALLAKVTKRTSE